MAWVLGGSGTPTYPNVFVLYMPDFRLYAPSGEALATGMEGFGMQIDMHLSA